jgi:hypothetical protein
LLWLLLLLRAFCGPPLLLLLAAGVGGAVVHAAAAPAASLFRALPLAAMCALRTEGRGRKGRGAEWSRGHSNPAQQLARVSGQPREDPQAQESHTTTAGYSIVQSIIYLFVKLPLQKDACEMRSGTAKSGTLRCLLVAQVESVRSSASTQQADDRLAPTRNIIVRQLKI